MNILTQREKYFLYFYLNATYRIAILFFAKVNFFKDLLYSISMLKKKKIHISNFA